MSIAQTVLALSKLHQQRHGDERLKQRRGRALSSEHAAPDGAWVVFDGSSSINMALLTELSRSLIPLRTAKNRIRQVLPGHQSRRPPGTHRRGQPLQSRALNAKEAPETAICGVQPTRPAPTGSVNWLVSVSNPRSAPRTAGRSNNGRYSRMAPQPRFDEPTHSQPFPGSVNREN